MTDPRRLFILVGLLAQALTWDSYWVVGAVLLLWIFTITLLKDRWSGTLAAEGMALVAGCVLSLVVSRSLQRSAHFFLGDGLVLLQLVRLTRPLSGREKLTSLIIAAFHFGVLCTLAPNVRFVILFTLGLFVLPGALKESFVESTLKTTSPPEFKYRMVPSARVAFWLLLGSSFVFIAAPRFTGTPLHLREGLAEQGSLLDSVLDPRRGGRENSQQVLMQIEGDNVGYLRCFGFAEFDGVKWSAGDSRIRSYSPQRNEADIRNKGRYLFRRVHVKNALYLGKAVPVDGNWLLMKQNFFLHPQRNPLSGTVETQGMWTTGNNVYEYYLDPDAEPEILAPHIRKRLLAYPPQSDRLETWLAEVTEFGTNSLQKARLVESHLRSKFTYRIGSPELDRVGAIDDFIFHRKEGHCERFAAAMGLLLRMQGIPSRVVVGYVPTTRNLFTGRIQVRFRDAHSWAEGYFEGKGWVPFDATPGPPASGTGSDIRDMLEALDFAWYSHVVNFNGFAQRDLFQSSARVLRRLSVQPRELFVWSMAGLLMVSVTIWAVKHRKLRFDLPRFGRRNSVARARHYYDQMLQVLERQGIVRRDVATPLEFLKELEEDAPRLGPDAGVVTRNFCRTFYGEETLSDFEQSETMRAVKALKREGSGKKHENKRG